LEKQKYLQGLLAEGINDVNWNKALKFIGNEIKGNGIVKQLKTERGVLRKQKDIADYFNEKFTLTTHDSKKMQVPFTKKHHEVNRAGYCFHLLLQLKYFVQVMGFELDVELLAEKLGSLPSNKSPKNTEITYEMLRLAPSSLAPYLYLLYKACLDTKQLPAEWLHSLVIPKHKGRGISINRPESYRPISLSPAVGKVLEHFVSDYLCNMLEQKSILHPRQDMKLVVNKISLRYLFCICFYRQHGHRKGYSNESQLACFVEDLSQFTRSGAQVDCIKIDLKSATSYVNHKILLARLKNLFVDRSIFRYLQRFIEEHFQSVKVGSSISSRRPMKQGLPQGSPLTNPLFLIYIDTIFDVMKNRSRLRCFGDDIVVYKMVVTADHQFCLQEDVYIIQKFFQDNGLQVGFVVILMKHRNTNSSINKI
jgi:Reverse transcriptase (RNA-dependent DNA polymerase)